MSKSNKLNVPNLPLSPIELEEQSGRDHDWMRGNEFNKRPENKVLNTQLALRLNKEYRAMREIEAKEHGVSLSDWLRIRINRADQLEAYMKELGLELPPMPTE